MKEISDIQLRTKKSQSCKKRISSKQRRRGVLNNFENELKEGDEFSAGLSLKIEKIFEVLNLLKLINTKYISKLFHGSNFKRSIFRYEFFLHLITEEEQTHTNSNQLQYVNQIVEDQDDYNEIVLIPPVDVIVIWIIHMLTPGTYHRDLKTIFNRDFDSAKYLFQYDNLQCDSKTQLRRYKTKILWQKTMSSLFINEPYNLIPTNDDNDHEVDFKVYNTEDEDQKMSSSLLQLIDQNEVDVSVTINSLKGEEFLKFWNKFNEEIEFWMEENRLSSLVHLHRRFIECTDRIGYYNIGHGFVWLCHLFHSAEYVRDCKRLKCKLHKTSEFEFSFSSTQRALLHVQTWNYQSPLFEEKLINGFENVNMIHAHPLFHREKRFRRIYVTNSTPKITIINENGIRIGDIKGEESAKYRGVAFDMRSMLLFTTNYICKTVDVFSLHDGQFVGRLDAKTFSITSISDIAISQSNRIMFVSDIKSHLIRAMMIKERPPRYEDEPIWDRLSFSHSFTIGGGQSVEDGKFDCPSCLRINQKMMMLFVVDRNNNRVQVFNHKGEFIGKFGKKGERRGRLCTPCGLAISETDDYFAVADLHRRVQIFDSKFHFICKYEGAMVDMNGSYGLEFIVNENGHLQLMVAEYFSNRLRFISIPRSTSSQTLKC